MTRRIAHALAALAVAAVATVGWAQPAAAAPPGQLCSLEEWRNPGSFADCAKRTKEAAGQTTGCVTAPAPGSPTSGMAGWFTSRPESALRDGVGGQYSQYGVGGYGLDTYDLGCLGTAKHPDLMAWNTIAKAQFDTAAAVVGAANGLRERAYDPGSMWGWADGAIETATTAVYQYVFTVFGVLSLAAVGLLLLWKAREGNMSHAMKVSAWAIFIVVAATGVARWPVTAAHTADTAALKGLEVVHSVLGPAPQDIPADKCVLGGDACQDNRSAATRSSDVVVDTILYQTWLRAMLGDSESETAKKYGPALFDATTLTWGEAERADQNPALRQQLIDQKAATFIAVADAIKIEDPQAYEHLQGIHGSDRAGSGTVAVLSAFAFAAFDISASLVILFAFLIFRIAVILFPLLGAIGVFMPASAGIVRIFHMSVAAVVNVIVFGAGAGLYLTVVDLVFRSSLPGAAKIAAVALAGAACFLLLRPARKVIHTATGRSRKSDSLTARLIGAGKRIVTDVQLDNATAASAAEHAGTGNVPSRPEATTNRRRTARIVGHVVAAVAPTVTSTATTAAEAGTAIGNTLKSTTRPESGNTAPRRPAPRPRS